MKSGDLALTHSQESSELFYFRKKLYAGMAIPLNLLIDSWVADQLDTPCLLIGCASVDGTLWQVLCEDEITTRSEDEMRSFGS